MNTFCDTNVIIGYIFSLDLLSEASKKALIKENSNYYSYHVKKEVNKTARRKNREYHKFLQKIADTINDIDDNTMINLSKIHQSINKFKKIGKLDVDKMHQAIETIWDELGFNENTEAFQVKINFNNYFHNFHHTHRKCKTDCFNNLKYIPAHNKKDKIVLDKIKNKSLRKTYLHNKDEEILFDAHEYLLNHPKLDLMFISADKDFIKAISILIDVLAFKKYSHLNDYLKN